MEKSMYNFLYFVSDYPDIKKPIDFKTKHPLVPLLVKLIHKHPDIFAGYLAHPNGDFIEIINLEVNNSAKTFFNAPEDARYMLVEIVNKLKTKKITFLDTKLNILKEKETKIDYDPRVRPWYLEAIKTDRAIKTSPYIFKSLKKPGITYTKQLDDSKIVVAVDMSLESLSKILNKEKFVNESNIFIFNNNGLLIASTTQHKLNNTLDLLEKKALEESKKIEKINFNGIEYLLAIYPIDDKEFIGISVPFKVMIKDYLVIITNTMHIIFFILLLSVPYMIFFTRKINKSISNIMKQNQYVAERKFDELKVINSGIYEFNKLSVSLYDMAQDIKKYQESIEELFSSIVKLIANTIDLKSKYTGAHCKRVPVIAKMIAEAASNSEEGAFKDFKLENEEQYKEIEIAAWLHDCGKLTTPEYIVDKSSKLETIYNRIHEIRTRFEVIWRDIEIEALNRIINGESKEKVKSWEKEEKENLSKDFVFIARCNNGDYNMSDDDIDRLLRISNRKWIRHFDDRLGLSEDEKNRLPNVKVDLPVIEKLLDDKPQHLDKLNNFNYDLYHSKGFKMPVPKYFNNQGEVYNLSIKRGTLNDEERFQMNKHIVSTIEMLENLPFPQHLHNVPEFAGGHHEKLDGTGYPRGLTREEMSLAARILAVADIFEALTATDRPYKKPKKLSESLRIMMFMAKDKHIDPEIYNLFLKEKIYLKYAELFLDKELIDEINIDDYLL
jgi:HD-GYP domain-containing protein (c-di-GMP phosphodiesterase class II)